MIIFADKQTIKQTDTNSKTEAHSNPLWIVGERANCSDIFSTRKFGIVSKTNISCNLCFVCGVPLPSVPVALLKTKIYFLI